MAVPDEITTVLSYTPELSVRPFSATRKFSAVDVDPAQVAQEVQADQVVTGQFLIEDDQLQVTIESIDIDQSRLSWRQRISLPVGDMTTLRATIGEAISARPAARPRYHRRINHDSCCRAQRSPRLRALSPGVGPVERARRQPQGDRSARRGRTSRPRVCAGVGPSRLAHLLVWGLW